MSDEMLVPQEADANPSSSQKDTDGCSTGCVFIVIIVVVLALFSSCVDSCSDDTEDAEEEVEEVEEIELSEDGLYVSDDFGVFEWSDHTMVENLPTPSWAVTKDDGTVELTGELTEETSEFLECEVAATEEDFNGYVADCREAGYTVDYDMSSTSFSAESEEGYSIDIYFEGDPWFIDTSYLTLSLTAPDEEEATEEEEEENTSAKKLKKTTTSWTVDMADDGIAVTLLKKQGNTVVLKAASDADYVYSAVFTIDEVKVDGEYISGIYSGEVSDSDFKFFIDGKQNTGFQDTLFGYYMSYAEQLDHGETTSKSERVHTWKFTFPNRSNFKKMEVSYHLTLAYKGLFSNQAQDTLKGLTFTVERGK